MDSKENSGYWNSGDMNSGNMNSGDMNSGDRNSGAFNTNSPKMRIFNKEIDMTAEEFYSKYSLYAEIPLNRWVDKENMTEEEKKSIVGWKTMGGYLKTLPFKEACKVWWKENPKEHDRFLSLPNFDSKIFEEITGINVSESEDVDVTVENKTVRISRKSAKALGLVE